MANNIPERPLVTEELAAFNSNDNDCRLARYVLYLEGEVRRLVKENVHMRRMRDKALTLLNEKDAALKAAQAHTDSFFASAERGHHIVIADCFKRAQEDKLALRAELEQTQAEVTRLREVELLAKDYRRAWKAFQAVPALHEETGSISWAEVDKAYGATQAALEELLAALGKEAE